MASFFKKINGKHPGKQPGSAGTTQNQNNSQEENNASANAELDPPTSHGGSAHHPYSIYKASTSPSVGYESPPISSLPSPPVSQLKDDHGKLKHFNHRSPIVGNTNNLVPPPASRVASDSFNNFKSFTNQIHNNIQSSPHSPQQNLTNPRSPPPPPSQLPKQPRVAPNNNGQMGSRFPLSQSKSNNIIVNDTSSAQIQATPWRKRKLFNSPFPRFGHAVSSLTSTSGALYLMGGLSGNEVYGDMWVIEPIRQHPASEGNDAHLILQNQPYIASPIENFQKVPSPRTGHASILIGNAFIIFGGDTAIDDDQALDNQLYFFNITSLKWTITSPEGPKPCGRYGTQISVLNFEISPNKWSSQLFVFGGELNDQHFNDLWKFDLSNFRNPNNKWIKLNPIGDIPPPLTNHSMTAYNEKIYIFGGQNSLTINDKLYCYDSTKNEWSICKLKGPIIPPALFSHSATIYGSLLFIFGGKLANETSSDELYIIDLKNMNSWKLTSKLPFYPGPRYGHSVTVNPTEEKLLIMGGDVYDRDFSGIDQTPLAMIDETQFSYASSIIYECDIKDIENFIDKPASTLTNTNQNENNIVSRRASIENENASRQFFPSSTSLDALEKAKAKSKSNIDLSNANIYDEQFASSTPRNASLYDIQQHHSRDNTTLKEKSNLHESRSISPKEGDEIETIDGETGKANNSISAQISPSEMNTTLETNKDEKDTSAMDETIDDYCSIDRVASTVIKSSAASKINGNIDDSKTFSPKSPANISQTSSQSALNTPNTTSNDTAFASNHTPGSAGSKRGKHNITDTAGVLGSLRTPIIQQAATVPFSPAVAERDNVKLQQLIKIVNDVKMEMKSSVANANAQIVALEQEKAELQEKLSLLQPTGDLEPEAGTLSEKNLKLRKFIDEDLVIVQELKNLVKEQDTQIAGLIKRIKSEEVLQDQIFQLESENNSLKEKLENMSLISESSLSKDEAGASTSKIDSLSEKVDLLVAKWQVSGPHVETDSALETENAELKSKVDQLQEQLKNYEDLFTESKNSLNKSHKALLLSQSETGKLKQQLKSVTDELDELKMRKWPHSPSNSRIPSSSKVATVAASTSGADSSFDASEENESRLIDDRYEIKIKDLEANVYIVSQERDQLREELTRLKKQMYNSSFTSPSLSNFDSSQ